MEIFRPVEGRAEATEFRTVATGGMEWTADSTPGFWAKTLADDGQGNSTVLMKMDPGCYAGPHAHEESEQVYVLEGTFHDQVATYRPGDFIERAPGAVHSTGSEQGGVVLLVFNAA